jgi:hypothetical protein
MNSYAITLKFTAPAESITLFDCITGDTVLDFLPITRDEMKSDSITLTSLSVERLDENGKPVVYREPESVAILSVEEQASLVTQHHRQEGHT